MRLHINRLSVISVAQQKLRRPIPKRHDSVGVAVWLADLGNAVRSCQSEIREFQNASLRDKNICGFHVSVEDLEGEFGIFSVERYQAEQQTLFS